MRFAEYNFTMLSNAQNCARRGGLPSVKEEMKKLMAISSQLKDSAT
jgi:hypothetical protein